VKNTQRGSLVLGIIIGVVLGLAAALAVAVYVTKVPVPFLNRGQGRTSEQDAAETLKNRDWDPNAPLYGRNPAKAMPPAPDIGLPDSPEVTAPAPLTAREKASSDGEKSAKGKTAGSDLLGDLATARSASVGSDPFFYFVQAGAFRTAEDAQAQRAKLLLMGVEAKISEKEQSGRDVFRVRVGPFDTKEDADRQKEKLETGGVETALVRVQR
jgi:cell division protein FtsN